MVSSSHASIGWLSPLKNTCCKLALAEDEKNSRGESGRAFWPGEDGKYKALENSSPPSSRPSCYSFPFFSVCILPLVSSQWL